MLALSATLRIFAGFSAILLCTGALAQTAQSLGAPSGDADRGRKLYLQQLCHTCHGTVGQCG